MEYVNYLASGFTHKATQEDPRNGGGELVLYNPTAEPCQATMTVYFEDREPRTLAPIGVKPETNALVVMPGLAPDVFTDCGFWGAKVLSTAPLILNFINGIRIFVEKPRFRGGCTNFHGTKLHQEWHFPNCQWVDWNRPGAEGVGLVSTLRNELEYTHVLNPNPVDTEITLTLRYRNLAPVTMRFSIGAERVWVWRNLEQVEVNQPYAMVIRASQPVSASVVRYNYSPAGFGDWGMTVRCAMYGVPGPVEA